MRRVLHVVLLSLLTGAVLGQLVDFLGYSPQMSRYLPSQMIPWPSGKGAPVLIAFDQGTFASDQTGASGAHTTTFSVTVAGGLSHSIMLVDSACSGFGTCSTTGVTYNGVALTEQVVKTDAGNRETSTWFLLGPASGTHNVVVSTTQNVANTMNLSYIASDFSGVNQVTPFDTSGGSVQASTGLVQFIISVTTTTNNAWIVDDFSSAFSAGQGEDICDGGVSSQCGSTLGQTKIQSNCNVGTLCLGSSFIGPVSPAATKSTGWGAKDAATNVIPWIGEEVVLKPG